MLVTSFCPCLTTYLCLFLVCFAIFDFQIHPKKKLARREKQGFRTVTKSVTDPDCGLFVKGEHKRQFAYEAHTACDKNGFVLETVVTPGNVHDSVAFDEVYDKVTGNSPQVEAVVADAAYKNASYLQESVRRWQSPFHSLQAPADHEEWTRVVEVCL